MIQYGVITNTIIIHSSRHYNILMAVEINYSEQQRRTLKFEGSMKEIINLMKKFVVVGPPTPDFFVNVANAS